MTHRMFTFRALVGTVAATVPAVVAGITAGSAWPIVALSGLGAASFWLGAFLDKSAGEVHPEAEVPVTADAAVSADVAHA